MAVWSVQIKTPSDGILNWFEWLGFVVYYVNCHHQQQQHHIFSSDSWVFCFYNCPDLPWEKLWAWYKSRQLFRQVKKLSLISSLIRPFSTHLFLIFLHTSLLMKVCGKLIHHMQRKLIFCLEKVFLHKIVDTTSCTKNIILHNFKPYMAPLDF